MLAFELNYFVVGGGCYCDDYDDDDCADGDVSGVGGDYELTEEYELVVAVKDDDEVNRLRRRRHSCYCFDHLLPTSVASDLPRTARYCAPTFFQYNLTYFEIFQFPVA